MAVTNSIKPITGALKRKIIFDITTGFALGGVFAAYWWWGIHKPGVAKRDQWYKEYAKTKGQ